MLFTGEKQGLNNLLQHVHPCLSMLQQVVQALFVGCLSNEQGLNNTILTLS